MRAMDEVTTKHYISEALLLSRLFSEGVKDTSSIGGGRGGQGDTTWDGAKK